jgi:signal transduction histidine kinase
VWVQDGGPGIPASFRNRIFQPFAQAEGPEVRNNGGTGLGLSIAKVFMERLGGTVDYETIEGQGSTFFICLPIQRLTSSPFP